MKNVIKQAGQIKSHKGKSKGNENWFLGTITDENARDTEIKCDFLSPNKKYQNIYDTISHKSNSYTAIDLLPPGTDTNVPDDANMKDELKSFLKKQLIGETDNVVGVDTLSSNFSNF